jgi:hypothetical protein
MPTDQTVAPAPREEINMSDPKPSTRKPRKAAISARDHADGPSWTQCTDACVKPSASQAHCTVCHRTFGGVSGFDKHRRDGRCIDPETLGMRLTDVGVWRFPISDEERERLAGLR